MYDEDQEAREFINKFLQASIKEQKSSRRWRSFWRLAAFSYVTVAGLGIYSVMSGSENETNASGTNSPEHVAIVDVDGVIEQGGQSSAESIIESLNDAFEAKSSKAVFININSPGGSPVQSAQVYREIMRLKAEYPDKPIYAIANDLMASGAYYIASAADKIYADPMSLVGSVGVIMSGFGFTDLMDKVGVERRVYTAGKYKSFIDPYSETNPETKVYIEKMLKDTHEQFIHDVRAARGDRIKGSDEELFNGLIWTGKSAMSLGLVDGMGSALEVARSEFKTEHTINYSEEPNPILMVAKKLGLTVSESFVNGSLNAISGSSGLR